MKSNLVFYLLSFIFCTKAYSVCSSKEYLVRSHFRRSYVKSDGTLVRSSHVKAYCKSLSAGSLYLKDRIKNSYPPNWPYKNEKLEKWSEDEIQRMIEALDEIPETLLGTKIKGFYRLQKAKDFPNPASNSSDSIVIYNSAFDRDRNLSQVLAHELSHHSYQNLTETDRQDYRRATGWQMELAADGNIYWSGRKTGYIEDDGANSHEEDFSNNLEYFLFNPDKLRKIAPGAYDWIQRHYGNDFRRKKGIK